MMTSTDHYLARMELCSGHGAADRGGQDQDPALRLHERDAVFVDGLPQRAVAYRGAQPGPYRGSVPGDGVAGRGHPGQAVLGIRARRHALFWAVPTRAGRAHGPVPPLCSKAEQGGPVVTPFALKQVARQCAQIRPWRGEIAQIGSIASTERDFRLRVGSSRSIPILALSQAALEMLREAGLKPTSKDPVAVSPDLSLFAERTAGEILWRATGEEQWRPLGR